MTAAKKGIKSSLGAPTQFSQSSRKGKRAWRKNIDIQAVEEGLESLRTEERVVGSILQRQTDDQLFVVDTKGNEQVRKSLPRYSRSQLSSTKILSQRSAVPAIISRVGKPSQSKVTRSQKEYLLRIAKRPRRGPFNAVMDPTEFGAGSAPVDVSHAVKNSGTRDLWAPTVAEAIPDGLQTVQKPEIKKPELSHPRDIIDVPAVSIPHQGASYNPPVRAHEELVMEAYKIGQRREEEARRLADYRQRIEQARMDVANDSIPGVALGMMVDEFGDDLGSASTSDAVISKNPPARKTKQQRARLTRQRAEKRALAEKAARKRLANSVNMVKSFRSEATKATDAREQTRLARQLILRMKLRQGLAGKRLGKHKVPGNDIEVQIGEDLSENLRNLKPEGNLFRDRFMSLQQRALIEPRVRVLPPRRRAKPIEYEKHAWKQFGS